MILTIILFIVVSLLILYKKRNSKSGVDLINLPPPVTVGGSYSVSLNCMDVKNIYLLMGTLFWSLAVMLLLMALGGLKNQDIALDARGIVEYIFGLSFILFIPIAFLASLLYIIYSRKKITWDNGVLIADKPANIVYFEIKRIFSSAIFLYLQSNDKTWILIPSTLEEMRKFKDMKVLLAQQAVNEKEVAQLRKNLVQLGVQEKKFNIFPGYIIFGFLAFAATIASVMIIYAQ